MRRLALGTVQFGVPYGIANQTGQVPLDEVKAILHVAWNGGINCFDTASAYGDSEERLGSVGITKWQIVSKLAEIPESAADTRSWVFSSVAASLRRLRVDRIYGMLVHKPSQLLGPRGLDLYRALQQLKDDGVVEKIGISIYEPEELDSLFARYKLDLVQAPLNVLDRRLMDSGWLARLQANKTEVHVRSIFLQGLLLMDSTRRPARFARWGPTWSRYEAWLLETGLTPLEACLRYALSFQEISRVVVGVENVNQLREVLAAAAGPAPPVLPDLRSSDVDLLNPSRWAAL